MDRSENPSAAICKLCGEAFTLPEDEIPGNLPRVLLCGHIYCTVCLRSLESDGAIRCPECEVESTLPEGGVYGLQEESRIIGLIYTTKMNKMKSLRCEKSKNRRKNKLSPSADTFVSTEEDMEQQADIEKNERSVDEALAKAAESLAQLVHIHETLRTGLTEQVKKEVARLEVEIKQAADKAFHAVQKWKDTQLSQLTKLETEFSASQAALCRVQEQTKALEIAMQMAREVRRVPFLEKYCILDKVLETLKAPVDNQSFDMKCINMGTGRSCVFQFECLNGNLALSLKMEVGDPKELAQSPPQSYHPGSFNRKCHWKHADDRNTGCIPHSDKLPTPQKQGQQSARANSPSSRGSSPSPKPHRGLPRYNSASDLISPDVIIEEFLDEGQEQALPPTGPELAGDTLRLSRRRKHQFFPNKRNVTQWVVVTHIVNPSHFYIRYVAEKKESEMVSHKINKLCRGDGCSFTVKDTVDTDSLIFVKSKEGLWCRARVVEVLQKGSLDPVKACAVTQMAKTRVFFLDHGLTKTITIKSEDVDTETSLNAVNNQLRKVDTAVKVVLFDFAPLAIRCSFKDLVPCDVAKGWSKEAQVEFRSVVGSAAVEMKILGQDRDFLLVDLRKAPMEQSSDVFISVREYLVFIEVARLYSPVTLGRRPLQYYPPVYPKVSRELGAVVSHISNPADFHIHLADNMEFMLLSTKLQEFYSDLALLGEDKLSIYCPVIGQACVARFDDGRWCRAQVIGHPGGRKVEVRYVDFGDRRILSVRDLRKIKDEFFALPAKAIHCCLSDVIPTEGQYWSDACTNRFISLAKDKLVTIIAIGRVPKSDPLPVKLFQGEGKEPPTNIAELLVKEELARFKEGLNSNNARPSGNDAAIWDPPLELGSATGGADTPEQILSGDQNEEPLEFQAQMKLPAQLKDLKVRVSHTNSPSSFYVQLTQYNSHLKRICELVKQECAQTEPQDVAWKADMYCAALFKGVWERAQICSDVTSSNTAEVRLCDHGNTLKIHVSYLRPLPSSLIGSLALECTLNDIRPTGGRSTWTDTACDSFCYYLTGASAVMTIKEMTDERPIPVTLFCSNRMGEFVSIADFLVSEGLALRERKPRDAVVEQSKDMDPQSPVKEIQTESETKTGCPPVSFPSLSSIVSSRMIPKPAPRSIMAAEKVKTSMYQSPELPCLGHIQINVSAIGDDGLIYFRTQNAENQLEQLRERIQQSMKALPRQKPYTWKSVLGCAVIGPDMLWYRGQLLEVLGGHVKVQYIDYGLVENIPVVHVYPILLCDDVPQLCITCQLLGINPVGGKWQRDAVALMRELLLNRCVDMNVVELPADPRGPLTIELFLDGLSLSRILCQHEHASMDRTVSPFKGLSVMSPSSVLDDWDINTEVIFSLACGSLFDLSYYSSCKPMKGLKGPEEPMLGSFTYPKLPQEGEHFKVQVKHLLTPNELFLWPLEGTADVEVNGETLEEALIRINRNIGSLARLSSFPRGGPCLAEYSDEKYYRARMVKFISVEPVMLLVHHVDFGSDDILPTSKLRQMPAELLQFPCRALKVKVAGFRAPSVTREENVLPYSPKWSLKAAMDMIDLLHTNITASVEAQEPDLRVMLYNEDGEFVHLPLVSRGLAELE